MFAQLLVAGLLIGGVYSLISVGLTLIFGVSRIVNFAQGEFIMLAMYGSFWLYTIWGIDPYLSILIVTPIIFILGVLVERYVVSPVLNGSHVMQIFATFGLSIILQNIALTFWGADYRSIPIPYASQSLKIGQIAIPITSLISCIAALIMISILFSFLRYTLVGKALRAIAENKYACGLIGINVKRLNMWAFGIGVSCAAVAGALLSPIYYISPTIGQELILIGFVIVVLGGLGSIPGALLGGLIIGVAQTLTGYYINEQMKNAIALVLFIVILVIRPQGLFGKKGSEELGK